MKPVFFWGSGNIDREFKISQNIFEKFYFGGYGAFYFFIPGFVSPDFGVRLEFSCILNEKVSFNIPFDIGIKIFITKENILRINSSFQFTYLSFNNLNWNRGFTIGIMIGYARKI